MAEIHKRDGDAKLCLKIVIYSMYCLSANNFSLAASRVSIFLQKANLRYSSNRWADSGLQNSVGGTAMSRLACACEETEQGLTNDA